MKTLQEYILDAQRKEEKFLWTTRTVTNTSHSIQDVLFPNFTSKNGTPCHNKATVDFYNRKLEK